MFYFLCYIIFNIINNIKIIICIQFFNLQFICEPNNLYKIRSNLEKLKYDIVHVEEEHIPLQFVSLTELEYENINKFINNVQELSDVIEIYDNIN